MVELNLLKDRITSSLKNVEKAIAVRDYEKGKLEEENIKLENLNIEMKEVARNAFREMSYNQKQKVADDIAKLATLALKYSIGGDSEFVISMDEESVNPRTKIEFYKNGSKEFAENPMSDNGGGIIDIISTSLRVVLMNSMGIEGPLILDEPFKMVSKEYVPALAQFMSEVSRDFGRQIIIVTHNEFLAASADKIITVEGHPDGAKVTEGIGFER